MKVNFVKTFIPAKDFVAVEKVGNKMLVRFDAFKDADMNAYSCVEGSVSESEYDEQEVRREYEAWKQKWAEKALVLAKKAKIAEIAAYDTSSAVNSFILNGVPRWLNLDKRQSIAYSAKILKEKGHDSITIWFDTDKVVLPIDDAISLLDTLEVYAKTTNNVTHEHMLTVDCLSDIEEVRNFDVTAGYPRKVDY